MALQYNDFKDFQFGDILVASGKVINLINPDPAKISLQDIANSLSKICRFGGNIDPFYSVAQHSCLVAWLAGPQLAKVALLHDAAEAYVGDVTRPLKAMLGRKYIDIEDRMIKAIFDRFGADVNLLPEIKEYDNVALEMEFQALYARRDTFKAAIAFQSSCWVKTGKSITWNWDSTFARKAFIETYNEIPKLKLV